MRTTIARIEVTGHSRTGECRACRERARFTVRKQSSGWAFSETFYVYDTHKQGRVSVHAHTVRSHAQADADRLNATFAVSSE